MSEAKWNIWKDCTFVSLREGKSGSAFRDIFRERRRDKDIPNKPNDGRQSPKISDSGKGLNDEGVDEEQEVPLYYAQ